MSKKRNYRLFLFGFLLADLAAAGALGIQELKEKIPDTIYLRYGEEKGLEESLDIPLVTYPDSIDVSERGSYRIPCSLLGMIPLKAVQAEIVEDQWVYVSGTPVGLYMETGLVNMPMEGMTRAISEELLHRPFYQVKIAMDCASVAIAMILSLVFLHHMGGLREGTILCAIAVAPVMRFLQKLICHIFKHELTS